MIMALNNKQIRQLKHISHALKPVVLIGQAGLSDAVINEIDKALEFHELIKVRVSAPTRAARRTMIDEIACRTNSELIRTIGHTAVFYRKPRNGKRKLRITLP